MYINSSVTPSDCNSEQVVLVHLNMNRTQADSFCPRCRCIYQTRNLSVIKVKTGCFNFKCNIYLFYYRLLLIGWLLLSSFDGVKNDVVATAVGYCCCCCYLFLPLYWSKFRYFRSSHWSEFMLKGNLKFDAAAKC